MIDLSILFYLHFPLIVRNYVIIITFSSWTIGPIGSSNWNIVLLEDYIFNSYNPCNITIIMDNRDGIFIVGPTSIIITYNRNPYNLDGNVELLVDLLILLSLILVDFMFSLVFLFLLMVSYIHMEVFLIISKISFLFVPNQNMPQNSPLSLAYEYLNHKIIYLID